LVRYYAASHGDHGEHQLQQGREIESEDIEQEEREGQGRRLILCKFAPDGVELKTRNYGEQYESRRLQLMADDQWAVVLTPSSCD